MARVSFTKMGLCWVAGGVILYAASQQAQSGLLFLVIGILFACYVVNLLEARRGLALLLTPPPAIRASEGQRVSGTWTVANPGNHPAGGLTVVAPWGQFFTVGTVLPRTEAHVTPQSVFPKRGVFRFDELTIHATYPFGFVRWSTNLACAGQVVVYPRVYACGAPPAGGYEPMLGGHFPGSHSARTGDTFRGVRPMQSNDPVKLIHWPTTSKGQGPMVREFDQQLSGRIGLIVGCETDTEEHLDWTARAAASLMLAAQDSAFQLEFVDLQSMQAVSVPPFTDGNSFLEPLARLTRTPETTTPEQLRQAVRMLPARSGLVLVLPALDTKTGEEINNLAEVDRRTVTVYLPTDQPSTGLRVPIRHFDGDAIL